MTMWSGLYTYDHAAPLNVKVRELISGDIYLKGELVPCAFFSEGIDCDFIYNPKHPLLTQFPVTPKGLLLFYLAERFKARDALPDILTIYSKIMTQNMKEYRIDKISLQERADEMFKNLREKMIAHLRSKYSEVLNCIHDSIGETEETVNSMLSNSNLITNFQNKTQEGIEALEYVPLRTLLRLVETFPEDLFDGKVFKALFCNLSISDPKATERSRNESKDRIISFLKDALWVVNQKGGNINTHLKNELSRSALSIEFLTEELVN